MSIMYHHTLQKMFKILENYLSIMKHWNNFVHYSVFQEYPDSHRTMEHSVYYLIIDDVLVNNKIENLQNSDLIPKCVLG